MGRAGGAAVPPREMRLGRNKIVNNFLRLSLDNWRFSCYIISVRESNNKVLLLMDATSANGEETWERERRL